MEKSKNKNEKENKEKTKKVIDKNFVWNMLGTTFNAFTSLFFMIIVTRINGIDDAGIFTIAFSTACILYLIGCYAGRIYQVTDNEKIKNKDYLINRIITVAIMIVCLILYLIYKRYDTYKATIFIILGLYKACEAFSEVIYAYFQKEDKLYLVGQSLFLKAVFSTLFFLMIDYFTKELALACLIIVFVNLAFIIFFDLFNIKKFKIDVFNEKVNYSNVKTIFISGFYIFAITFLGLFVMNAPKYAIDTYMDSSSQAIFGIIIMPATVVSLFAQYLIHPYLNQINNYYKERKIDDVKKVMQKINGAVIVFGLVCLGLAYFLGIPVLNLLYNVELSDYKIELLIILIAATLYVIATVNSAILTTIRQTKIQFVVYIIVTIIALVGSYLLTYYYNIIGATIAYFSTMASLFVLYTVITYVMLNKEQKKLESQNRQR